jgi:hypothetical protein
MGAVFGVDEYPDIEAAQKSAKILDELQYSRYVEAVSMLGTLYETPSSRALGGQVKLSQVLVAGSDAIEGLLSLNLSTNAEKGPALSCWPFRLLLRHPSWLAPEGGREHNVGAGIRTSDCLGRALQGR